ncbi:DNA-binding response regulator [Clostridium septicum]|uniref:Stage 0 sporulation protein A homolog n=2 Tax=Clostridium septicum TaxID=1504 RepID=A0A9N7JK08_CLOSE|nr:response regulator transcription factor [Clostridium septicum]AYE33760.1 DNA-binding response regulator [Clostridium septicum]QAS61917.1 response regulator transcription factor [Clostridium septicum]UEC22261.1 response regulator transcription factor [Clostridium septicum]USS02513.1 response regulator transcription factor [Clostridium septicum]WLF71089.1 response regulator transcription factor [Clostridium septicum]
MIMKILIAEDKMEIANLVRIFLQKEGYEVILANDGEEALKILLNDKIDLCIFDIMMPKMDGFTLIQKTREFSRVPILVLTAKNMEQDKILGLDLGADDYITKPFSSLELVSRVNAHIRRSYKLNQLETITYIGDLKIDKEKYIVYKNDVDCTLTAMEYKLLLKLLSSPERVFTKSQLYESVCGNYMDGDENTIAVHISRLREKIEDNPKEPEYIKTIRGLGYKFEKK